MSNLKVLDEYANGAGCKPENIKFNYFLQASVSLYSWGQKSFVGRTYTGKAVKLDPVTLLPMNKPASTMEDQALFYSRHDDPKLDAVVEFVLIIKEAKPAGAASARAGG